MTAADLITAALAAAAAALLIVAGTRLLAWLVDLLPPGARRQTTARRWLPAMQLALAFAIIVAIAAVAFDARVSLVTAAAVLILLATAAWFAIRDVIAGIVIRADHGLEEEQIIRVEDATGTVLRVGARSVEIETMDGRRVRVPYGRLRNAAVSFSGPAERTGALRFPVTLPRSGGTQDDVAAIRRAALHVFYASASHEPRVRLMAEDTGSCSYEVTVYAEDPAWLPAIEQAVLKRLEQRR